MNKSTKQKALITTLGLVFLVCPSLAFAWEDTLFSILNFIVTGFFAFIFALSALLLNYSINEFVIQFGQIDNSLIITINRLWENIRDIFNMTFIFGLIYIGFKMILRSDDSNSRRWLVHLLIAALLVNFSLYFTKIIIDAGNLLATEIAQSGFYINDDPDAFFAPVGGVLVSETFAEIISINSSFRSGNEVRGGAAADIAYILGTLIIYIIGTFAFMAGGLMLTIRFVMLILYMILSPLMFLGWVFPQLQSYSSQYWRGFFGQVFMAPAYILLLYLSAKVLAAFRSDKGSGDLSQALTAQIKDERTFSSTIIVFILSSIFLITSVVLAKKLSDQGASGVVGAGKWASNFSNRMVRKNLVGRPVGVIGAAGRKSIGRGADTLVNNNRFKTMASNSWAGKQVFKGTQKVAGASFDARNIGAVSKQGLGKGQKGGFTQEVKDKEKADEKFAKDIHINYDENSPEFLQKVAEKEEVIKKEMLEKQKQLETSKNSLSDKKQNEISAINNNSKLSAEEKKKALEEVDKKHSAVSVSIDKNLATLAKNLVEVNDRARSAVKYEPELNYIKQQENSVLRKNLVGTIPFINQHVSLSIAKGKMDNSIVNLKKQYGEFGEEAVKRKKQKDSAKIRAEADKELLEDEKNKSDNSVKPDSSSEEDK